MARYQNEIIFHTSTGILDFEEADEIYVVILTTQEIYIVDKYTALVFQKTKIPW